MFCLNIFVYELKHICYTYVRDGKSSYTSVTDTLIALAKLVQPINPERVSHMFAIKPTYIYEMHDAIAASIGLLRKMKKKTSESILNWTTMYTHTRTCKFTYITIYIVGIF